MTAGRKERPSLKRCDILVFRGGSFVSRAIRALTRSPGEQPTFANHVGMAITSGLWYSATVQEAVFYVRRVSLSAYLVKQKATSVRIYRPLNLTHADSQAILKSAAETSGRRYGYGKILLHALDWALGQVLRREVYGFRRLGITPAPICSWDVARHFQRAGYSFGVEAGQATPDDIDDFCRARPDHYELLYWGPV